MKRIKFELGFDPENVIDLAEEHRMVVFNPINGDLAKGRYVVEISNKPIGNNVQHIVDYVIVNWDTLNKTGWNVAVYCDDNLNFHIGMVYVTDCASCAVDTCVQMGNSYMLDNGGIVKPYIKSELTKVETLYRRKQWLDKFKTFKTIEIC